MDVRVVATEVVTSGQFLFGEVGPETNFVLEAILHHQLGVLPITQLRFLG